jgi:hypothetical protein
MDLLSIVSKAQPGDTIIVAPGEYEVRGVLNLPDSVTLDGRGRVVIHTPRDMGMPVRGKSCFITNFEIVGDL